MTNIQKQTGIINDKTQKPARGQPLKGLSKTKRVNVSINAETDAQLRKINKNRSEAIRMAAGIAILLTRML
jgi:hypothetical protein